jgi:hypothetical protein
MVNANPRLAFVPRGGELTLIWACDYQRFSYAEHCSAGKFF